MTAFFDFLQTYEFWIYFVLGVFILIYMRSLLQAWMEWRGAIFGLEKETAMRKIRSSLSVVGLLVIMVTAQMFVVSFIIPTVPKPTYFSTPTIDVLATSTAELNSSGVDTINPTSEVTPTSAVSGCSEGVIEWVYPSDGVEVSGRVTLEWIVNVENLGFFKYEYSQQELDTWVAIAAGNESSPEIQVGDWNTATLITGDYQLRLLVYDNNNSEYDPCIINVRVLSEGQE